jgi:ribose/xylose/arabinose/galactoside ABC-type transport system permease subunit
MQSKPKQSKPKTQSSFNLRDFLFSYGFLLVLLVVVIYFSVAAPYFFSLTTLISILHTAAPMLVLASGIAFVIMTAKLDISVGSTVFLASSVGAILITRAHVPFLIAVLAILGVGFLAGAINGFTVVVLRVNPLIATLGTMMALRGLALQLTNSMVISLPQNLRALGGTRVAGVYVDILFAFAVLVIMQIVHTRTTFGRQVMAIGNSPEIAERLGVKVKWIDFWAYVLCGVMAALGGVLLMLQLGAVSPDAGSGYEFSAIAMAVIGGVSLFGGEGTIIPGIILGGFTLTVIQAGLNYIGASVYVYPFVRGGIIFIAMFADALKVKVKVRVKMISENEPTLPMVPPGDASTTA